MSNRAKTLVCLFGLMLAGEARAFTSANSLFLRAGFLQDNFGRVSSSDSGGTSFISGPLPAIGLSLRVASFMPSVSYTFLGRSGASDTSKAKLLVFEVPYLWTLTDALQLKTGLAMIFKSISGSGGSVTLNNGNSTMSFAKPGRGVTSSTAALHLGGALTLTDVWRLDLDGWISDAFSARRAISIFLSANWGIL